VRRLSFLFGAGLTAAVLAGAGCRRSGDVGRYPTASVVLVSIDTLRADRLPLYGYGKGMAPKLDALAREGIVFDEVVSHCPMTLPAHASLLTGLLPMHHGVRDNSGFALAADRRTLATRLHAAGLETGAAVSAYVLRAATGIAQGFDRYDDALPLDPSVEAMAAQQRDGAQSVDSLLGWIDARPARGRFFAFLHLYEPHAPYTPPPSFQHFSDPYDGEVAYADELVGRLVSRLREKRRLETTVLAVTADHGEGLGDHGEQEHGFFLYREAVHVPLVLRLPDAARAGTHVRGPVAQVDIAATLLDLIGLPADDIDGRSQRTALASGVAEARPVYSETFLPRYHFGWSELLALTDQRYRYIHAPRPELFDAQRDPSERNDVASQHAEAVRSMAAWLQKEVGSDKAATPAPVAPEVAENLRALGYVSGAAAVPPSGPLLDPKDKIKVYESYRHATTLHARGEDDAARQELRIVLGNSPGMVDAWHLLGLIEFHHGREAEALKALDEVIRLEPTHSAAHLALARIHAAHGRLDPAMKHAEVATATLPGEAFETLAELMLQRERLAEAAQYARRSLDADRSSAVSAFVLAEAMRRQGQCGEAIPAFRRAIEAQQLRRGLVVRNLHAGLADCLARLGQYAEAEKEFLAEIQMIPHSREGRTGLAILYRSQARDAEARQALEGIVSANPNAGPEEYWTVVRSFRALGDLDAARQWAARARARYPADRRFAG
jgi:choline-sulfatase